MGFCRARRGRATVATTNPDSRQNLPPPPPEVGGDLPLPRPEDYYHGDDNTDIGSIDQLIGQYHQDAWNELASCETLMEVGSDSSDTTFVEHCEGVDVEVEVPSDINDDVVGFSLDH